MCKSGLFLTSHHSLKPLCSRPGSTLVVPGRRRLIPAEWQTVDYGWVYQLLFKNYEYFLPQLKRKIVNLQRMCIEQLYLNISSKFFFLFHWTMIKPIFGQQWCIWRKSPYFLFLSTVCFMWAIIFLWIFHLNKLWNGFTNMYNKL